MPGKIFSLEGIFQGGVQVLDHLKIPVLSSDPVTPLEGWVWINSTTDVLKYHNGTGVQSVPLVGGGFNAEDAQDAVGGILTDTSTINFTYNDAAGTIVADVLDSPTVGGYSAAALQTAIIAAIVDSAPGTLDTLNELAAALGDDPNFVTTVTASLATKARTYAADLTGGSTTEVVTHSLGTRDIMAQVFVKSGTYQDEEYIIQRTSTNTITVVSEGQNIPAGRRILITSVGA